MESVRERARWEHIWLTIWHDWQEGEQGGGQLQFPPLHLSPAAPTGDVAWAAAAAVPWPTLVCYLTFPLSNLPSTAGGLLREKQKEAAGLQGAWKDTAASVRAETFLGKEDMLLFVQIACDCCKCRSIHWHWKGCSLLGKGLSPLVQPLHPSWRVMDCHRKEERKWCYHAGIYPWWIEDELSVRKIKKATEERKVTNQIFISTKPQTWKSWAESLTLLVSRFMYSGQLETKQCRFPAPPFRAPSFRGILCLWSNPPTYIGNWVHFSLKSPALTNKIKEIKFEFSSLRL